MKNSKLIYLLITLTVFSTMVSADDTGLPVTDASTETAASSGPSDPTLAFFAALSECTPGSYTEKNVIADEVGQSILKQQIVGKSDDNLSCNAKLATPDGRIMTCAFPMEKIPQFNDQHFMQGILEDTTDSPSHAAISADLLWSQMKVNFCTFGQ